MSLFSGLKTIKKPTPEPKVDTPDAAPKGFNSATAHGLYDPKQSSNSATTPAAPEKFATVGDGGASWKRRALLRAKQKADLSGKSLTEVVTDLHGSSVKEMHNASKGGYERWKGPRKSYNKPREPREEGDTRGGGREASGDRGGGLRLGRGSSDADVLKRFKGKVKDGFQRAGLDSKSPPSTDRSTDSHKTRPHASSTTSNKKREREPESEVWDKNKFEDILKQSEDEEALRTRTRMKTDIWDEVEVSTPHHKVPPVAKQESGGNVSAAAAMRARLTPKPTASPSAPTGPNSNMGAAAAMRARMKTPGSDTRPQVQTQAQLAPLDREGRRLLALLEGDVGLDQKEDARKGKWRGKAKGGAAAAGGEEGAKRVDVTTMAAFEREGGEDMDEVFARNISRLGGRFKGTEDKAGSRAGRDEEEEVDMKMYQNMDERVTAKRLIEIQKNKAVGEERRYSSMVSHSPFSVDNPHFKHRLVMARGNHCFVMLMEKKKRLVPGHCYIVALQQAPSSRAVQEEVWDEMADFKKALRRSFGGQGLGVLFLETALIKSGRAWANVECLPVPLECEEDAPLYFKQALSGAESEWSTHRAIIDTARGLRKVIPPGFAYFHVEWARGGCAHIIEDAEEFGADFGSSVVAGMIGVDHRMKGSQAPDTDTEIEAFKTAFASYNPMNRGADNNNNK